MLLMALLAVYAVAAIAMLYLGIMEWEWPDRFGTPRWQMVIFILLRMVTSPILFGATAVFETYDWLRRRHRVS